MMIDLTNVNDKVSLIKACYAYLMGMQKQCTINEKWGCCYTVYKDQEYTDLKELYEASDHCVIGALIPFERYSIAIENIPVCGLDHVLPEICVKYMDILEEFQDIHDRYFEDRDFMIRLKLKNLIKADEYDQVFGVRSIEEADHLMGIIRDRRHASTMVFIHPDVRENTELMAYLDSLYMTYA